MGRMKEAPSPTRTGGAAWVDVSPRRRCPVCEGDSWCQVSRDGDVVLCKHIASERKKENREHVTFYVHRLRGYVSDGAQRIAHVAPQATRASSALRNRAYRIIFSRLDLDACDREALARRGLDRASIEANGYRTLPLRGRAAIARAVIEDLGESAAASIPGIVWRTDDTDASRGWWSLAGSPGVVVPVRDLDGLVVALKVRRRDPIEDGGQRYLYVTSAKHGGASAESAAHVPVAARAMRGTAGRLILTEGELKSDLATALLGEPVVSVPGVSTWRAGVDLARVWGVRDVVVAFDAETKPKPALAVARATRDAVDELRRAGLRASVWIWDARLGKGIDDVLARGLARTETGATDDHAG